MKQVIRILLFNLFFACVAIATAPTSRPSDTGATSADGAEFPEVTYPSPITDRAQHASLQDVAGFLRHTLDSLGLKVFSGVKSASLLRARGGYPPNWFAIDVAGADVCEFEMNDGVIVGVQLFYRVGVTGERRLAREYGPGAHGPWSVSTSDRSLCLQVRLNRIEDYIGRHPELSPERMEQFRKGIPAIGMTPEQIAVVKSHYRSRVLSTTANGHVEEWGYGGLADADNNVVRYVEWTVTFVDNRIVATFHDEER